MTQASLKDLFFQRVLFTLSRSSFLCVMALERQFYGSLGKNILLIVPLSEARDFTLGIFGHTSRHLKSWVTSWVI